jgi:hypothetical protein
MRILIIILLFSVQSFGQTVGFLPIYTAPSGGGSYPATYEGVIYDDGYYNGFPFTDTLSNGDIFSVHKKSDAHAPKGPLIMLQSSDGGVTNSATQVTVDGTPIEIAALSFGRIPSTGRLLLAYCDDETYTFIKFAKSDDEGATWTQTDSLNFGSGYSTSPSPVKMLVMPSGKIRMGYYAFGLGANPAIIGFINSTDDGESWTVGEEIFSHGGTGFGDNKGHEFGFVITDNTGVDSTCKMIVLVRNADFGSAYMHYYSADGGATWNTSFTVDDPGGYSRHYMYNFGVGSAASPVDIIEHNDSIYVVAGHRNEATGIYQLQYIVTTKDNAYINNVNNWGSVISLRYYNAVTLGSSIDCGYPVFFKNRLGELWVRDYDVSTEPLNPAIAADRCWIYQFKIAD